MFAGASFVFSGASSVSVKVILCSSECSVHRRVDFVFALSRCGMAFIVESFVFPLSSSLIAEYRLVLRLVSGDTK
ncbi:hypothetical protein U1Q18_009260 [Sarracenia purpurea var. burkii]